MDVLHNRNLRFGPISLDEIEERLYLGALSAATDVPTLTKHKITHVLTIDVCALPQRILQLSHITFKFIQLSDQPKEDIMSHFEEASEFIGDSLKNGGVILVHCFFGVSRSATLVIAYIMKKHELNYTEAFELVRQKRRIIFPNAGFVMQLKLYKEMGYRIDPENKKYRLFRLKLAADCVKKTKILPLDFFDVVKTDPGITQVEPEPKVYRCRQCRRIVACESNLITHPSGSPVCRKTYFVEPLAWMPVTHKQQEKLYCPKCKTKLGSFSWIMGSKCPCGVEVAPAFYLVPSKVDFCNVVKNVELTF